MSFYDVVFSNFSKNNGRLEKRWWVFAVDNAKECFKEYEDGLRALYPGNYKIEYDVGITNTSYEAVMYFENDIDYVHWRLKYQ